MYIQGAKCKPSWHCCSALPWPKCNCQNNFCNMLWSTHGGQTYLSAKRARPHTSFSWFFIWIFFRWFYISWIVFNTPFNLTFFRSCPSDDELSGTAGRVMVSSPRMVELSSPRWLEVSFWGKEVILLRLPMKIIHTMMLLYRWRLKLKD